MIHLGPETLRRLWAGAVAGAIGGLFFVAALHAQEVAGAAGMLGMPSATPWWPVHVLLGSVLGALYSGVTRQERHFYAAAFAGGLLFALFTWILDTLTLRELIAGNLPSWSVAAAREHYPTLLAYLLYGGTTGYGTYLVRLLQPLLLGEVEAGEAPPTKRVVILGGGFGGVAAAQELERSFTRDPSVEITVVSLENYLLFTPMLTGVASSSLEPDHISPPLRALLRWSKAIRAEVSSIDPVARTVRLRARLSEESRTLEYDELVLALGSVPSFRHVEGAREHALAFRTLQDAMRLRNQVISVLERADAERDAETRRRLLTFVAVGGGYSGVEAIAELRDTVRDALRYYPSIPVDTPRFVLIHSHERIMEQISEGLASYAQGKLEQRGVEFILDMYVSEVERGAVVLEDGTRIPAETVIWTAGVQPNPLIEQLDCEKNPAGAVVTDPELRVKGLDHVWAIGDCAENPDYYLDGPVPLTAQHAERAGKRVGRNIAALFEGRPPRPFRYESAGMMVPLGHRIAVADIRGVRFSGQLAWLMWRAVYLAKLPGLEKKVRVALDWLLALFFPRDIVLTRPPALDAGDDGRAGGGSAS